MIQSPTMGRKAFGSLPAFSWARLTLSTAARKRDNISTSPPNVWSEPVTIREFETARRQQIVLSVAELALGDRGAGIVEIAAVEAELRLRHAIADARRPRGVGLGRCRVALVQPARADVVDHGVAVPAARGRENDARAAQVVRRHLQAFAGELRGYTRIKLLDEIAKTRIVIAVAELRTPRRLPCVFDFELAALEPLPPRVLEDGRAVDRRRRDKI